MKYIKTDWKNTVYDKQGIVLQKGTPLIAANMKKIEDGIVKNETDIAEIEKSKTRANGIATLNEFGELKESQIPSNLKDIDTHSHTNRSTLDKLVYSGEKTNIDLIQLEELAAHTHHASKITTNEDYQFVTALEKEKLNDDTQKMDKVGGDFEGVVKAYPNTSYALAQIRNIILSTTEPNLALMKDGEIWIKYV